MLQNPLNTCGEILEQQFGEVSERHGAAIKWRVVQNSSREVWKAHYWLFQLLFPKGVLLNIKVPVTESWVEWYLKWVFICFFVLFQCKTKAQTWEYRGISNNCNNFLGEVVHFLKEGFLAVTVCLFRWEPSDNGIRFQASSAKTGVSLKNSITTHNLSILSGCPRV